MAQGEGIGQGGTGQRERVWERALALSLPTQAWRSAVLKSSVILQVCVLLPIVIVWRSFCLKFPSSSCFGNVCDRERERERKGLLCVGDLQ